MRGSVAIAAAIVVAISVAEHRREGKRSRTVVQKTGVFTSSSRTSSGLSHHHRRDLPSAALLRSIMPPDFQRTPPAKNYTDFYPGGSCNNRKNATWSPLTLLTTIPYIPQATNSFVHAHINETLLAQGENCRIPSVVEIHIVVDNFDGSEEEATKQLRENVYLEQSKNVEQWQGATNNHGWKNWERADPDTELVKLIAHVFGRQPTYSDLFRYAEERLPNRTVGITNADIVLRNPEVIDYDSFTEDATPIALCLSVRPPSDPYASLCRIGRTFIEDRCVDPQGRGRAGGSWDVTIFRSPLVNPRYDLLDDLDPTPVYMNQMAGEERAGYFLAESGYRLYNPCTTLIAEHWHCSKIKTHHASFDLARIVNRTTGTSPYNIRGLAGGMVLTRDDPPGVICRDLLSRTGGKQEYLQGRLAHYFFANATLARMDMSSRR